MPLLKDQIGFEKTVVIPGFECDAQSRWALSFLLRHAQQVSKENTDALGMTYQALYARRQVFLLSRLLLQVRRMPRCDETVRLVTIPMEPVRSQFVRTTWFYAADGEELAVMDTAWILVDPESRRILRPASLAFDFPVQRPCERTEVCKARVTPCASLESIGEREVRYSDLDLNGHMTNARYADILCDYLPDGTMERDVSQLLLCYEHEARLGDRLEILRGQSSPNGYCLVGRREGTPCFSAEITLR